MKYARIVIRLGLDALIATAVYLVLEGAEEDKKEACYKSYIRGYNEGYDDGSFVDDELD